MSSNQNKQIITIGVTALVTFLLTGFLFSATDLNLFGTATDDKTTGTFLSPDGEPARRTLVQAYAADGSVYMDVTSREGIFELEPLQNGNYIILGTTANQQYGYIGTWTIGSAGDTPQFEMVETGSLSGTVAGCSTSCTVTLMYEDVAIVVQNTQADGSFVFSGLAPAVYEITVYQGRDVTAPQNVEIESGKQTQLSLSF